MNSAASGGDWRQPYHRLQESIQKLRNLASNEANTLRQQDLLAKVADLELTAENYYKLMLRERGN